MISTASDVANPLTFSKPTHRVEGCSSNPNPAKNTMETNGKCLKNSKILEIQRNDGYLTTARLATTNYVVRAEETATRFPNPPNSLTYPQNPVTQRFRILFKDLNNTIITI